MNAAGAVIAIAASVVIVIGGIGGIVRQVWKVAQTVRDNTAAIKEMREVVDARFSELGARMGRLEAPGRRRRL